jgi:CRISPR-associated exonuclease Cas4
MTAFLITLLVVALFLRWRARQLVGRSTRPQDVVHFDTGPNDRVLTSHRYKLTGQPDYILEEHGERFPMERKSRDLDARGPYDGERLQLAAYCLLLEEEIGTPVRHGRLEYRNRTLDIPFDSALRAALLKTLRDIQQRRHAHTVRRNHSSVARCRGCGFRDRCWIPWHRSDLVVMSAARFLSGSPTRPLDHHRPSHRIRRSPR